MTGFNLPPGVSVNDIPGNRSEDMEEEAFWYELELHLKEHYKLEVEDEFWNADWFVLAVTNARDMGYAKGYDEGVNDLGHVKEYQEKKSFIDHAIRELEA